MTIDQLVPLTDGLSVTACAQTLAEWTGEPTLEAALAELERES